MDLVTKISLPTLLLDERKCRKNIKKMVEKTRNLDLVFRPHFKTHQSHIIGRWFRDFGVNKITASSLRMAEYFAEDDWDNITVAFPVNIREIDRINSLAQKITLTILVEAVEAVDFLLAHLHFPIHYCIKIDVGTHRTGVSPYDHDLIKAILHRTEGLDTFKFSGFLAHTGHTYSARSKEEIEEAHHNAVSILSDLKRQYIKDFPNLIISYGDTPSCSISENFKDIDEIRPGNFVFYDITQTEIGSCGMDDIAVAMACPVVAIHRERSEIVVYGGGIHFSKDRITMNGEVSFGKVVQWNGHSWENPTSNSFLRSLSQEHGIVKASPELISSVLIGENLIILPIHSCMSADLVKSYLTLDGELIDEFLKYN